MLATVENVLWPKLHREVVGLAKHCQQCQVSGKNKKPMLRQKERGDFQRVLLITTIDGQKLNVYENQTQRK